MSAIRPKIPPTEYKNYRDVKRILFYITWILFLVSLVAAYLLCFTWADIKQQWKFLLDLGIGEFFALLSSGGLLAAAILFGLSYVLIFIFQIHDLFYDRFITRWRQQYDVDVILWRLTSPIRDEIPKALFDRAIEKRNDRYRAMKPYYDFVGDDVEGYIRDHTRERFYDAVMRYWITQIAEMLIVLFVVAVPIYSLVNPHAMPGIRQAGWQLGTLVVFVLNRLLARSFRMQTRSRTLDEIEEIHQHEDIAQILRDKYRTVCKDLGLTYHEPPTAQGSS